MRLNAVKAQLIVSNIPRDMCFMIFPLKLLVARYPHVNPINKNPRDSSGTLLLALMNGHAIPSSPSGRPRLMKARKVTRTKNREPLTGFVWLLSMMSDCRIAWCYSTQYVQSTLAYLPISG